MLLYSRFYAEVILIIYCTLIQIKVVHGDQMDPFDCLATERIDLTEGVPDRTQHTLPPDNIAAVRVRPWPRAVPLPGLPGLGSCVARKKGVQALLWL